MIRIDADRAVAGREGALVAVGAGADAAGYADPGGGGCAGQVEAIGIDEFARVLRLAAQRHGVAARRAVIAAARLDQPLGHRDIAHAVGRFGQLDQDPVGDRHRLVHDPQRTGPAEPGELQAGGGVPLGDVAGHVDPAEEERHALGISSR